MQKLNVIIKGFLRTGSSALQDMLLEYDTIGQVPGEFNFFRRPKMVGDHLQGWINKDYPSAIGKAIRQEEKKLRNINFLVKYYLRNSIFRIVPDQFFKMFGDLPTREFNNRYNGRKLNLKHLKKLDTLLESDASLAEKISAANQWINEISHAYAPNKKYTLFNHAIWEEHDLDMWTKVFAPFKIIFVYRDPRDQVSDIILDKHLFRFWNLKLSNLYGRDRESALKFNVSILDKTLHRAQKVFDELGPEKAMMISFEDLVLNYEESKFKIEKFLGLNKSDHTRKHEFLDPDEAKKHIGIYKNVLTQNDLAQIEKLTCWYADQGSRKAFF